MTEKNNVVGLYGAPCGVCAPSPECVAALRDLLERAEAGEVVGIGAAVLHHAGDASCYIFGAVGGFGMLGALEMVRAELVNINGDKP